MQWISRSIYRVLLLVGTMAACTPEKVDFSTQVKPILNKRCISCHGGVKQNGGFSVLFPEDALVAAESGKFPIVPGDAGRSEMIRRIRETDPELRMPYRGEPLTPEEISILSNWIDQGAEWGDHWAYDPPRPVEVPRSVSRLAVAGSPVADWAQNDIDYFILEKLQPLGLKPSPEAGKPTLMRRVYLDLIGLPPTPEQADAFLKDTTSTAYEKLVDNLLSSPHFGEKWASWWLDLARYADTKGYEADPSRVIWRYRDYVIKSFNADMPFDQFAVEQLAGDMLPNPTDDQMIATAFHRNTMNNDEGGTDDEEFRTAAVIDRVGTTWEIFQSTTMSCVQCHSHPYDPIRFEEYYKSFAFFNNTRDEDVAGEHPLLRMYEEDDQQRLDNVVAWVRENVDSDRSVAIARFLKTLEPKIHAHHCDDFENGELNGYKWLSVRPNGYARLSQVDLDNKRHLFINYSMRRPGGSFSIHLDGPTGKVIGSLAPDLTNGSRIADIPLAPVSGVHDLYFVFRNPALQRDQTVCSIEWFSFQEALPSTSVHRDILQLLNTQVDNTPVFVEGTGDFARETRVFERGNWLVKGALVEPGVPESLNPKGLTISDRLSFARWLVSKDNPLTARVMANRFWEQIFGYGLIETLEDFGTQGASPTHPELLDWLALRLMDHHRWSIKKFLREILLSATYRQDSRVTPEALATDSRNVWLARAPRVRLSAEQVRDQALAASGILSNRMYGKSVMPHQPEGIWMSVYNGEQWTLSEGEDRHRRGVYTFIKRTSPYPSMITFDGSSREVCVGRRIRTNTPLQALVTLNDPVFVESARALALRMMEYAPESREKAIARGYWLLKFQEISGAKLSTLVALHDEAMTTYRENSDAVRSITASDAGSVEQAAMVVVANALLNLDEVIMKE